MALLAGGLGLAGALTLSFLTVRPNRLAAGVGQAALSIAPELGLAALLPALAVGLAFLPAGRARGIALGMLAVVWPAALVLLAGRGASRLLAEAGEFARVSVGAAAWIGLLASLTLGLGASRDLRATPLLAALLRWAGPALALALVAAGAAADLSVAREYLVQAEKFRAEAGRHLALAGAALALSALIGLPLGLLAARRRTVEGPVLALAGVLQTVPSVALLGLLIAPLSALAAAAPWLAALGVQGIGAAPALVALTLYGLLPVVRGTVAGLRGLDPAALDAGRGMGMTGWQLLARVELPLALPLVLDGLRTSAVSLVGLTTVASLIGAGGLGFFVFGGLGAAADDLVLLGALPVLGLALATDASFRALAAALVPRGLRA